MSGPVLEAVSDRLVCEWDELAGLNGAPPFLRAGWFSAWWRAFGRGRPVVATLRAKDGTLRALLPVTVRGPALVTASNWHTPEMGVVATDEAAQVALLRSLLADGPAFMSFRFTSADLASSLERIGSTAGRRIVSRPLEQSPFLVLDGTWQEYERTRGAHLRAELRRRTKRLHERGDVSVVVDDGGDHVTSRVVEGMRVEAAGWKGRSGTAMSAEPHVREFYLDVARWAAEHGWLRLARLRLDDRAVAVDVALEHQSVQYLLKTGYDEEFRSYAPGKLLRAAVLRDAHERGLRRYEFLGDKAPWKSEWTTSTAPRLSVQAYEGMLGCVGWWVEDQGRNAVRLVRSRRSAQSA